MRGLDSVMVLNLCIAVLCVQFEGEPSWSEAGTVAEAFRTSRGAGMVGGCW